MSCTLAPSAVEVSATLDDALEQCSHGPRWIERGTTTGQDVADAVAFLASDAARLITGTTIAYSCR
jgi:NAD(P)-dependent dehydrogenase (short-subunit alcohol dehydrogenase family)